MLQAASGLEYEIYSPDVFNGVLYLGGWRTAADTGPDRLYKTSPGEDVPVELRWNGAAPYAAYHMNDPSVVRRADGSLAMFATALPNIDDAPDIMTSYNVTGLVTSTDNGATWTLEGIVIGQNNGFDSTGAWSPSAVVENGGISVWYNTGSTDVRTGRPEPIRVMRTMMDATGTRKLSTAECINVNTLQTISAENVDVRQAADGTYWMAANDFSGADGDPGKIVLYQSQDGLFWTPWSVNGATLLSPQAGGMLMTPAITSIGGDTMTVMYAEQAGASATVEHSVTLALSDQPGTSRFTQAYVFNGVQTSPEPVTGQAYNGPVDYLQSQLIYAGTGNINLVALGPNAFLHGGAGQDALVARSGHNVLDGGQGSNFLTGGSGQDVFFLVASGDADSWSTVVGFKGGDELTLWDVTPGMWDGTWTAGQGAVSARGATLHIPEASGHEAALTLAGFSTGQADALSAAYGTAGGRAYLHFQG